MQKKLARCPDTHCDRPCLYAMDVVSITIDGDGDEFVVYVPAEAFAELFSPHESLTQQKFKHTHNYFGFVEEGTTRSPCTAVALPPGLPCALSPSTMLKIASGEDPTMRDWRNTSVSTTTTNEWSGQESMFFF